MTYKLGKLPAKHDPRTLMMTDYLDSKLPIPPAEVGWTSKIHRWPMMGNDAAGDCVFAGGAHAIQQWTAYSGKPVTPSDAEVIAAYSAFTGYDPADPSTDVGTNELDFLKHWRKTGFWGHKIEAFIGLQPRSQLELKDAIWFFGNVFLGIALPRSIQGQKVWAVPPGGPVGDGEPGSLGGHCVIGVYADLRGVSLVTWGGIQRATYEFMECYTDEAYAILSRDWLNTDELTPGGVSLLSLEHDLKKITHV